MNEVNKLLIALGKSTKLNKNNYSNYIAFKGIGSAQNKRWLANIVPADLLKLSVKECIEIIEKIFKGDLCIRKK